MNDIKNYDTFTKIEPIHKGWSKDKKFYVETDAGEKLLIRVSNISEYENKKQEFEWVTRIFETELICQSRSTSEYVITEKACIKY